MKNVILKNHLPDLPKNYRWKFEPWIDGLDRLTLQKKWLFWWDEARYSGVLWQGDDVVLVANELLEKEFGPHTRNPFYGTSD